MNNLMIFDGREVEVFEFNRQVLFNPKHVAECLGIKNVNDNIRVMNEKQVIKLTNSKIVNPDFRKLHNTGENFLTESGVYKLIFKSRKKEAEKFQDWVTGEVLPSIRQTGGYIPHNEEDSENDILAKAVLIAQKTIEKKNKIIEEQKPLVNFANKVSESQNSLLVREVAKLASKKGISIGEKRLWQKLRDWNLIFKNSREPKQYGIDRGYFEVIEGTRESSKGTFTYQTTRITGKGQVHVISRLEKEMQF